MPPAGALVLFEFGRLGEVRVTDTSRSVALLEPIELLMVMRLEAAQRGLGFAPAGEVGNLGADTIVVLTPERQARQSVVVDDEVGSEAVEVPEVDR